ncbi:TPA: hypothetical protein KEV35_004834 [Escherichia coli]|nr:hypothetical protein [Escherichia coli]
MRKTISDFFHRLGDFSFAFWLIVDNNPVGVFRGILLSPFQAVYLLILNDGFVCLTGVRNAVSGQTTLWCIIDNI